MARDYSRSNTRTRSAVYSGKYPTKVRKPESRKSGFASRNSLAGSAAFRENLINKWSFSPKKSLEAIQAKTVVRTLILVGVLLFFALTLVDPVKSYWHQNNQIKLADKQTTQLLSSIEQAKQEQKRLSSPDYTEIAARKNQQLVMPDETPYIITSPIDSKQESGKNVEKKQKVANEKTWSTRLWNSVSN